MKYLLPPVIVGLLLLVLSSVARAGDYVVNLNTTSGITEAQVRTWLNEVGYEPLTRLARVDVVDEGYTYASVGGGCYLDQCWVFDAAIQANSSGLLAHPWYSLGHEYGHVWANYFQWTYWRGSFDTYLVARGIDPADPRLDYGSAGCWNPVELIAEDYRELFAAPETTPGVSVVPFAPQCGWPASQDVPGLRDFLALTWTQGHPPPGYGASTPTVTPTASETPTPVVTATPSVTSTPSATSTPRPCKGKGKSKRWC